MNQDKEYETKKTGLIRSVIDLAIDTVDVLKMIVGGLKKLVTAISSELDEEDKPAKSKSTSVSK